MIKGYKIYNNNKTKFVLLCKNALKKYNSVNKKFNYKWKSKSGHKKLLLNPQKNIHEFDQILYSPEILKIIEEKFKKKKCNLNHAKLSFKYYETEAKWFPHQDSAYVSSDKNLTGITIAVLLKKNTKNCGNLTIYKDSHKKKHLKHKILYSTDEVEPQLACSVENYKKKIILGDVGDIIVWDIHTVHSSEKNLIENFNRPIFIFTVIEKNNYFSNFDDEGDYCYTYNYTLNKSLLLGLCKILNLGKLFLIKNLKIFHFFFFSTFFKKKFSNIN